MFPYSQSKEVPVNHKFDQSEENVTFVVMEDFGRVGHEINTTTVSVEN